jgi:hypothetical protein
MIADAIQQTPAIRNGDATNPAASHQNITPPDVVEVLQFWGIVGLLQGKKSQRGVPDGF